MTHPRLFTASFAVALLLLVGTGVYAWTSPNQAPPDGNVAAPVNVGTTAQVKNGALSVNRFMVNEHMLLVGPVGATQRYLNFNSTLGNGGYGFRDNNGVMQVRNATGNWRSLAPTRNMYEATGGWGLQWNPQGVATYYASAGISCPPGERMVFGGAFCDAAGGPAVALIYNNPNVTGTGWYGSCVQTQPDPGYAPGGVGVLTRIFCEAN